jgi:hypothetical protein
LEIAEIVDFFPLEKEIPRVIAENTRDTIRSDLTSRLSTLKIFPEIIPRLKDVLKK